MPLSRHKDCYTPEQLADMQQRAVAWDRRFGRGKQRAEAERAGQIPAPPPPPKPAAPAPETAPLHTPLDKQEAYRKVRYPHEAERAAMKRDIDRSPYLTYQEKEDYKAQVQRGDWVFFRKVSGTRDGRPAQDLYLSHYSMQDRHSSNRKLDRPVDARYRASRATVGAKTEILPMSKDATPDEARAYADRIRREDEDRARIEQEQRRKNEAAQRAAAGKPIDRTGATRHGPELPGDRAEREAVTRQFRQSGMLRGAQR